MSEKGLLETFFVDTKPLYEKNKDSIHKYNTQIIPKSFLIGMVTVSIPILFSIFRKSMRAALPGYLSAFFVIGLLWLLYAFKKVKIYPILYAYAFATSLYGLVIYLSIVRFPDRPAGTALIYFAIVPLLIMDRSHRVNIYTFSLFAFHLICAFIFKDISMAMVDVVNTFISVVLGVLFGRLLFISRLNTFEFSRQLMIEKETDFLTGLSNRRRLYKDLETIRDKKINDIGILMMDIDYFKEYNDNYGHIDGDRYLRELSYMLQNFEKVYPVKFYRFGGEEFVCITTGINEDQILRLADNIRQSTKNLSNQKMMLSVSIGVSICDINCYKSIESFLVKADEALYKAKKLGRDRVEVER